MSISTPSLRLESQTLDNGLVVVSVPDAAAPLLAVNLWYGVGSRNEVAGRTGFAHLFEHLMFQGSRQVEGTGHFAQLQAVGATLNGTTSFERTNYYETVPRHASELALWLEADRMATLPEALNQANLDNQRDVVRNERRQRYDNVPYGTAYERLFSLVFPEGHPYHHMPIGSMEDLAAASLADAHGFFAQHYRPSNAVLTLTGGLEPADAFTMAQKYFGGIESGPRPPAPDFGVDGPLPRALRHDVRDDVPLERFYLAWRVPAAPARVNLALGLALSVLCDGGSSRLMSRLVRQETLANSISGGVMGLTGGSDLALVTTSVRPGESRDRVETLVHEEVARLAAHGPSDAELELALTRVARATLATTSSLTSLADEVSRGALLHNDPRAFLEDAARVSSISAAEVQAASALLLDPCATLTYSKES